MSYSDSPESFSYTANLTLPASVLSSATSDVAAFMESRTTPLLPSTRGYEVAVSSITVDGSADSTLWDPYLTSPTTTSMGWTLSVYFISSLATTANYTFDHGSATASRVYQSAVTFVPWRSQDPVLFPSGSTSYQHFADLHNECFATMVLAAVATLSAPLPPATSHSEVSVVPPPTMVYDGVTDRFGILADTRTVGYAVAAINKVYHYAWSPNRDTQSMLAMGLTKNSTATDADPNRTCPPYLSFGPSALYGADTQGLGIGGTAMLNSSLRGGVPATYAYSASAIAMQEFSTTAAWGSVIGVELDTTTIPVSSEIVGLSSGTSLASSRVGVTQSSLVTMYGRRHPKELANVGWSAQPTNLRWITLNGGPLHRVDMQLFALLYDGTRRPWRLWPQSSLQVQLEFRKKRSVLA